MVRENKASLLYNLSPECQADKKKALSASTFSYMIANSEVASVKHEITVSRRLV